MSLPFLLANIFSKDKGKIEDIITIRLKDKIDEKVFGDILIKEGFTKISIEMKNSEKSDVYNFFKFENEINTTDIAPVNMIGLDAKNSCLYINIQTASGVLREIGGGLTKGYFGSIPNNLKKANIENLGDIVEGTITSKQFIASIKEILFREKILDEVYDKSEEYKNNLEKYAANTDDIIEKIEEEKNKNRVGIGSIGGISQPQEKIEPYDLFIIKHFIKYVIDKYKEENISSEDNSANENSEDNKNITTNPFITNGE